MGQNRALRGPKYLGYCQETCGDAHVKKVICSSGSPGGRPSDGPDAQQEQVMKYRNKKVVFQGETFDSQGELARWLELRARQQAGEITDLERQVRLTLQPGFVDGQGHRHRSIVYIADFAYIEVQTKTQIFEDFKGFSTKDFKIKAKLLQFLLKDRQDTVFRVSYARPVRRKNVRRKKRSSRVV
jgi:hypothetical protein